MVPHRGTNLAALRLTLQIGRDAVLSESYGRGCYIGFYVPYMPKVGLSNGYFGRSRCFGMVIRL